MTKHPETQLIKHYENSQDFSQKGKLDENKGVKIANKNSHPRTEVHRIWK